MITRTSASKKWVNAIPQIKKKEGPNEFRRIYYPRHHRFYHTFLRQDGISYKQLLNCMCEHEQPLPINLLDIWRHRVDISWSTRGKKHSAFIILWFSVTEPHTLLPVLNFWLLYVSDKYFDTSHHIREMPHITGWNVTQASAFLSKADCSFPGTWLNAWWQFQAFTALMCVARIS